MSKVSRIETIRQDYAQFWNSFRTAANQQGLSANALPNNGVNAKSGSACIVVEALLFLREWPYKSVSQKRNVDIAVAVSEVHSNAADQVLRSVVRVGYFEPGGARDPGRALLELHYDYEFPCPEAHPVFHAQLGAYKWPQKQLRELGLVTEVNNSGVSDYYKNARIPTPHMGYAPVLVSLAADHLDHKGFRDVVAGVQRRPSLCARSPVCDHLTTAIVANKVPAAHEWYERRYQIKELRGQAGTYRVSVPALKREFSGTTSVGARQAAASALGVGRDRLVVTAE